MFQHLIRRIHETLRPGVRARREARERDEAAEAFRIRQEIALEAAEREERAAEARDRAYLRRIRARGYRGAHIGEGIGGMISRLMSMPLSKEMK
jgi:hypothetical protein